MAKITEIPTGCPQCGGEVWDNTKRPKRNPKAPDVACKDKEYCKWAGWLPKSDDGPKSRTRPPQQYPWAPLFKLCVQYTKKELAPLFDNPSNEVIKELAATLFITASKEGGDIFKKVAPAPAPPPPPRPAPPPRQADYDDSAYTDDDGLPF